MKICAFDFDGTLTKKDTFVEFIRYVHGERKTITGFLLHLPLLLLMKLHLYSNQKAKQKVFSCFFHNMEIDRFNLLCRDFAHTNKQRLLRPSGIKRIRKAIEEGDKVIIISASIDNWVCPFFDEFGGKIQIEGTQIEVKNGHLTGVFTTANCYGQEKVNRLKALYPQREDYHLTAFGDSRGDKELINYADKGYFKPFRD